MESDAERGVGSSEFCSSNSKALVPTVEQLLGYREQQVIALTGLLMRGEAFRGRVRELGKQHSPKLTTTRIAFIVSLRLHRRKTTRNRRGAKCRTVASLVLWGGKGRSLLASSSSSPRRPLRNTQPPSASSAILLGVDISKMPKQIGQGKNIILHVLRQAGLDVCDDGDL